MTRRRFPGNAAGIKRRPDVRAAVPGNPGFVRPVARTVISLFDLAALLLTLSALFGWINRRFLRLPHSIGLLLMALATSLVLVGIDALLPNEGAYRALAQALREIDFPAVVMNGMLAFLLFAGAFNVNLDALRDRAVPVASLAVVGTIISTVLVGFAIWLVAGALGPVLPLPWALVFGALISPTDPVAVLSTLRHVHMPKALQVEMEGEALFNDGVGIVLFTFLLSFAIGGENNHGLGGAALDLLREAGGGLALGLATGYVAYRAMRTLDDFPVEVLITLALVTATYAIAARIGVSGPLAVVAAGLLMGERAPRDAMSEETQNYVFALWTLIDEVLNSVLFLLIGLEVVVLRFAPESLLLAGCAVPIVLVARLIAVSPPLLLPGWRKKLSVRNVPLLAWAGVHGGISVALALSLPNGDFKSSILSATYVVVLFSIVVQGGTLGRLVRFVLGAEQRREHGR
jgi:CPA1 family monovalent cation:H+ antiporter